MPEVKRKSSRKIKKLADKAKLTKLNEAELIKLQEELLEVKSLMKEAYIEFNRSSEPELIEASVYKINSLQSWYSYVLRKIKGYSNADGDMKLHYPKTEFLTS